MRNRKVIILNGMQRGGTNVVWNLLQSHPDIVSPIYETGQIIYPKWLGRSRAGKLARALLRTGVRTGLPPLLSRVDRLLHEYKMRNLDHPDNRYKAQGVLYTPAELESTTVVTKSVGDDVRLTPALAAYFPDARCISVVRNGFAVCEGWIRRGIPPERAAGAYVDTMNEILRLDMEIDAHLVVKFEQCIEDPLGQLVRMCDFAGIDPDRVDRIRIKAKAVLGDDGSHDAAFGVEGRKIWIDPDEANRYLDPQVTRRQADRLPADVRERVAAVAGDVMRRLGYTVE